MKLSRRMAVSLLLLSAVGFVPALCCGQTKEERRQGLKGLLGFEVVVENFETQETISAGLSETTIKTDVELRLRKAGIKVLSREESSRDPRAPYLYVKISLVNSDINPCRSFYGLQVSVEVMQSVMLMTSPASETTARTWDGGIKGVVGKEKMESIRNAIADLADRLINDYLAANGR